MGQISDIPYHILASTSDNFLRLETLREANDIICNATAALPIFHHYDIAGVIHSSSDGQKFETAVRTFNARHSPKYLGLSQEGGFPGGSLWTIPLETCSIVGELTPIGIDGGSPMSTITQRIASAFVVLCGRYGDVTKMAHDREQSRQSLYREASQVANAVDGTAVQSRIDELQRQLAGQQAQIQDLQERLEHAIEITRDKQDEFASVAQAEGVSLSVARRLLQVVAGSVTTPSVPTLGRATEEAGQLRRPVARSARRGGPTQGQTGHRRRNFFLG